MTRKVVLGIFGLTLIAIAVMAAPDIKRYIKISTM